MANIKSKKKNIKRIERNTIRNRAIKSKVRTAIKKVRNAVIAKEEQTKLNQLIAQAHKEINQAVSKGVLHKNNGARKQGRLDDFVSKNIAN